MINALLMGIFKIVTSLVNVLLSPVNALINSYLPDLANIISLINKAFGYLFGYVGWWTDAMLLNSETVSFIILYWTIKLTLPLTVNAVKLAIKWYDKIKP